MCMWHISVEKGLCFRQNDFAFQDHLPTGGPCKAHLFRGAEGELGWEENGQKLEDSREMECGPDHQQHTVLPRAWTLHEDGASSSPTGVLCTFSHSLRSGGAHTLEGWEV